MSNVLVIPRIRFRAWDGTEPCEAPLAKIVDLREALEAEYRGDACILQYAPQGDANDLPGFPRLTYAATAYFEMHADEPWPMLNAILVDVDYDDHAEPPDGWAAEVVAKSPWPCGWYRTPHGLRLVYEPKHAVPVCKAGSYLAQLHAVLQSVGIQTDEACTDWTRLSIAPKALDRDLPYDFSALGPLPWHPERLEYADAMSIGPIVARELHAAIDCIPKKLSRADLGPLGKSRLADLLYRKQFAAPEGQRHATILRAAQEIVAAYDTNDPLVPFGLLAAASGEMGKDPGELWRVCEWTCAHRSGIQEARSAAAEAAEADMAEETACSPGEARARTIIDAGKEFFVWDEERLEYSTGYGHAHQLLGALERHAPNMARGYYEGKGSDLRVTMRDLSTVADRTVLTYRTDGPIGYDKSTYTFYRRICKIDRDIRVAEDPDVARWLAALFGDEIEHGLDWLAMYPCFDQPVCALYINGPKSIGKGMLASGLARLTSRECVVTPYAEVMGTFNPTLKRSPLIYADEKVPQDAFVVNDSSVFRRIIGNNGLAIRDLNRSPVTLDGYPRVLITANNEDALGIREELNVEDLDAIRIRIGYIHAPKSVGDVLREISDEQGYESTREMTESWVAGGRIAGHVLWLSKNRKVTKGSRFLVEGWESELTRSLPTSAGAAGQVAEVLALLISKHSNLKQAKEAVVWHSNAVFVNNAELGEIWRHVVSLDSDRPPNSTRRLKALKALSGDQKARLSSYDGSGARKQLTYWKIPIETLARLAEERNICPPELLIARASQTEEEANSVEFDFNGSSMEALAAAKQAAQTEKQEVK
jgi:hypothetical protein